LPQLPLYRRIADDLRRSIAAGKLPAGARLPSSRALAMQLGVSRNSVTAAYETLLAEGILVSRRGSGTIVHRAPTRRLEPRSLLREAHYPADAVRFEDPEGNTVYLHR
jgi:GntR family transcriptional regulator/MocR family aminotransferase